MALSQQDMLIVIRGKDESGPAFQAARRGLDSVKEGATSMKGALAAAGVTLSAAGIQAFIKGAVDELAKVGDIAGRVNATTDAVQALQNQLKLGGGNVDDAEQALQRFAVAAAEVGQSGNYLTKIFQANAVALRDTNGALRSSDALLQDYSRLVANASDQQTKLMLTTEAFGRKAGPAMVAVLEDISRRGLQALITEGKAAGTVLENDVIKKAQELDRAFKQLELQGSMAMKKLALEWAPSLITAFETIRSIVKDVSFDLENLRTGNIQDVLGIYLSADAARAAQMRRYQATGSTMALDPSLRSSIRFGENVGGLGGAEPTRIQVRLGENIAGFNKGQTVIPSRTDPNNRTEDILALIRLEGEALTLNLEKRREAERLEAQINFVKRAGKDVSEREKEEIRGAVDALYAKKRAYDEMKRSQEGFTDSAKFGGDQLLNVLDAATDKSKNLTEAIDGVTRSIIQATMRAAVLGDGPLAGIFGTKGQDGNIGGLLGMLLNPFSPSSRWDASSSGGSIADPNAWAGLLPGRAGGGSVRRGGAYMVGEEGPEPFFPTENGIIVPNGFPMGGGGKTSIVINNYSGEDVSESRMVGPDGDEMITLSVGKSMSEGKLDGPLAGRMGARPRAVKR